MTPGEDFEKRRLAGAVAADQRQPLALADGNLDVAQKRRVAVSESDIL